MAAMNATANHPSPRPVTLDQLAALNDELAALARAGVPLESGLESLGRDWPGPVGRLVTAVAQRLQAGGDLVGALEQETDLPPAYRAVVLAGLRAGRLAVALEGVSAVIRRAAETRRLVLAALIYPAVVLLLAYGLFLFTLLACQPAILAAYDDMLRRPETLAWLRALINTAPHWAPWVPLPLLLGAAGWWWTFGPGGGAGDGAGGGPPGAGSRRWPGIRGLMQAGRLATFADCLALMIEHAVPLPDAVRLAADASGDRRLREAGEELASRLQQGGLRRRAASCRRPCPCWRGC